MLVQPVRPVSAVASALVLAEPSGVMVLARTRREVWEYALSLAQAGETFSIVGLSPERLVQSDPHIIWLQLWRQLLLEPDPGTRQQLVRKLERIPTVTSPLAEWRVLGLDNVSRAFSSRNLLETLRRIYQRAFPEGWPPIELALTGLERKPDVPLVDAFHLAGWREGSGVRLSTVHGAKGLEADVVVLAPSVQQEQSIDDLTVSYVAVTRAKQALLVHQPDRPWGAAWHQALGMSRAAQAA